MGEGGRMLTCGSLHNSTLNPLIKVAALKFYDSHSSTTEHVNLRCRKFDVYEKQSPIEHTCALLLLFTVFTGPYTE